MKEYTAKPHPAALQAMDLMDQWDGTNGIGLRRKLNALIKEHPDLIQAYNYRREILDHEDNLTAEWKERKRAFEAVMTHYFPDGLPDSLPWGWLENRPLLTALTLYAESLWVDWKKEEADKLFRKILSMNPEDNQGARFSYLAFLEKISYKDLQDLTRQGMVFHWFKSNCAKYTQLETYGES
jgi:hypothetical protein